MGSILSSTGCVFTILLLCMGNGAFGCWDIEQTVRLKHWWPGWHRFYMGSFFVIGGMLAAGIYLGPASVVSMIACFFALILILLAMVYWSSARQDRQHYVLELPYTNLSHEDRLIECCRIFEYLAGQFSNQESRPVRIKAVCQRRDLDAMLMFVRGRALVLECLLDDPLELIRIHCVPLAFPSPIAPRHPETGRMANSGGEGFALDYEVSSTRQLCYEIIEMLKQIGVPIQEADWRIQKRLKRLKHFHERIRKNRLR